MNIYHGSQQIVEFPRKSAGKNYNDYGQGFYCTQNAELAKEWSCPVKNNGYVSRYTLHTDGLKILHLTSGEGKTSDFHILNWLAILLQNRTFDMNTALARQAKDYIMNHFTPKTKGFDVIIGYRADDSYFSFAEDFVNNAISLRDLEKAMHLGKLGEQIVLISEKAFGQIHYEGYDIADYRTYYFKRKERDKAARADYQKMKKNLDMLKNDLFILDIIREGMTNEDVRLR